MSVGSTGKALNWLLRGVFQEGRGGQDVRKKGKEVR